MLKKKIINTCQIDIVAFTIKKMTPSDLASEKKKRMSIRQHSRQCISREDYILCESYHKPDHVCKVQAK
jgi:hypothetical protein